MSIITISRQIGSLGTEIARNLSETLGYAYLDKIAFGQALNRYGLSGIKIEQYDEKKPHLWDLFSADRDRYLLFMKMVIYDFAGKGNTVIVGRGGQVLLGGLPGTVSVRVEAPLALRSERLKEFLGCDIKQAERFLRNNDNDRNGFHRFFFNANWEDTGLYDLVINTRTLGIDDTVSMIRSIALSKEVEDRLEETKTELANLSLSRQIEAKILYEEEIPIQYLEVNAKDGLVTLQGAVTAMPIADRCELVARSVDGVRDVVNEFTLVNYYGMM